MGDGDWRDLIGHDGWFVVRLRLFTADEGGQGRHLQSGFKATWTAATAPHPMSGPLVIADEGRRSIAPGQTVMVHVHPIQPLEWIDVEPGTPLRCAATCPGCWARASCWSGWPCRTASCP